MNFKKFNIHKIRIFDLWFGACVALVGRLDGVRA